MCIHVDDKEKQQNSDLTITNQRTLVDEVHNCSMEDDASADEFFTPPTSLSPLPSLPGDETLPATEEEQVKCIHALFCVSQNISMYMIIKDHSIC